MSISQKTLHKVIAICLRWSFLSHIHKVTVQEQELQLLVSKHCAASDKKVTFQLFPLESSVLVMRVMQQDAEQNARYDIAVNALPAQSWACLNGTSSSKPHILSSSFESPGKRNGKTGDLLTLALLPCKYKYFLLGKTQGRTCERNFINCKLSPTGATSTFLRGAVFAISARAKMLASISRSVNPMTLSRSLMTLENGCCKSDGLRSCCFTKLE